MRPLIASDSDDHSVIQFMMSEEAGIFYMLMISLKTNICKHAESDNYRGWLRARECHWKSWISSSHSFISLTKSVNNSDI